LDDGFDYPIDKKTIRELMSYEMLMELVLSFLRERKGVSTLKNMADFDSDPSKLFINRRDSDIDVND
jgi:hypothetical protein